MWGGRTKDPPLRPGSDEPPGTCERGEKNRREGGAGGNSTARLNEGEADRSVYIGAGRGVIGVCSRS